jgi:hypothetical protein
MKLQGLSPNNYIHVSEHINRSQKHDCGNWDWGRAVSFLEVHKSHFLCSVAVEDKRNGGKVFVLI